MAVAVSRVAGRMSAWLGFSGSRLLQDSATAPMAADDPCRPRHGHASPEGALSRPLPVCRATRRRHSVGTVSSLPIAILCSCAYRGHTRSFPSLALLDMSLHPPPTRGERSRWAPAASFPRTARRCRAAAGAARGPQSQRSRMRGKPEELVIALTGRERQIMELVLTGLSNREVGKRLHISERTISPPASYLPEALDPQPDCACQYRPYVSAVPATAEQVMA